MAHVEPSSRIAGRDRNAEGRPENARPRDRFGAPLPRDAPDELGDRVEPDDVCETALEALDRATELFAASRFFEAHEFLEFVWKSPDLAPEDRGFWKGVTQVAVGCCHTQRGNTVGATTLLRRATRYMEPYPARHGGVDAAALRLAALELADRVEVEGAHPEHAFPALPRVEGTPT